LAYTTTEKHKFRLDSAIDICMYDRNSVAVEISIVVEVSTYSEYHVTLKYFFSYGVINDTVSYIASVSESAMFESRYCIRSVGMLVHDASQETTLRSQFIRHISFFSHWLFVDLLV
jgi:hypothetical protein